jgi:hypothetical protein
LALRLDVHGRAANGDQYKRLSVRGVSLDLFVVMPGSGQQWGASFIIRTG